MRKKFLTLYDYGMGGVWIYICANSAEEISERYPELEVLDREPDWFDDEGRRTTKTVDIDDPPDVFLRGMRKPVPTVYLELRIEADELVELRRLVKRFAETEGFVSEAIRHYPIYGRSSGVFDMYLLRPDIDMRVNDLDEPCRLRIDICDAKQSPDFDAVAARFQGLLESRWPGRLRPRKGD